MIFLVIFLASFSVSAENRVCQVKNRDKLISDDVEHQFSFSSEKSGQSAFNEYMIMFFRQGDYINLVVKNIKADQKFTSQYHLEQKHIKISMSPHFRLNCYTDSLFAQINSKANKFDANLADYSDLADYKASIAIKINKTLNFKYNQKNVQKGMRPIIFQYGNAYTADDPRDDDKNHCTFRIGIKTKKDIQIFAGTLLKVSEVNVFENSAKRRVLSYSFVNTLRGRKPSIIRNTRLYLWNVL